MTRVGSQRHRKKNRKDYRYLLNKLVSLTIMADFRPLLESVNSCSENVSSVLFTTLR